MKARILEIIKRKGLKNPELEKLTGISRYTWQNIRNKPDREIKEEEISAIIKIYPQYALWIASGQTAPEAGQTNPDYDEAHKNLPKPAEG